ncbi:MAG: HD-GYP domain-containing protein [Deltaproteobacteria bacterium]|nr:HD-GYP domain-containing protein [Deltaproteobacteria bacterium]
MIKKIAIDELEIGMYVSGLEKEGSAGIFFMNNIKIKSSEDIERFKRDGYRYAHIDMEAAKPPVILRAVKKAEVVEFTPPKPEPAAEVLEEAGEAVEEAEVELSPVEEVSENEVEAAVIDTEAVEEISETENPSPIVYAEPEEGKPELSAEKSIAEQREEYKEELREAKKIRNEAEGLAREFLTAVKLGGDIKTDKVHNSVGKMVDSIFRNQDALTTLSRLKSFDDYTFAHSVNVCILSVTLGRSMGLSKDELHNLGVGAILHDIGKMLVPEMILKKPGRLTENEFEEIKRHTDFGAEILFKTKDINDSSRFVPLQHHERYDGSGYQYHIPGTEIHKFARIAAVADVYDAMTSNRVYQNGILPEDALKKIYLMRETHLDPEIVERLIKCLGIYPIGALVELNTGEVGIVKMLNRAYPLQPMLLIVCGKDKKSLESPFELDLVNDPSRSIIGAKGPEAFGIPIEGLIA